MVSSFVTIAGETLSNLDGLTSGTDRDDEISQEIVINSLRENKPHVGYFYQIECFNDSDFES